jgi:hypothetical protein
MGRTVSWTWLGAEPLTQAGTMIYEADETLPVELDTMALLRAKGLRVVVSRTQSSTVLRLGPGDVSSGVLMLQGAHDDVAARDICANLAKADVLVGIYFDAGFPHDAGSLTAYDAYRPFSTKSQTLAGELQANVLAAMKTQGWDIPDAGVLSDIGVGSFVGDPATKGIAAEAEAYGHLLLIGPAVAGFFSTPSSMPGAVIEPLNIIRERLDPPQMVLLDPVRYRRAFRRPVAGIESCCATFNPMAGTPSTHELTGTSEVVFMCWSWSDVHHFARR